MESVLVIGATGHLGRYVVRSSAALGHTTLAFVRPSALTSKSELIDSFRASKITIVEGTLDDTASLIDALKRADVVVSAIGSLQYMEELKLLSAIKQIGTIKRFVLFDYVNFDELAPGVEFVEPVKSRLMDRTAVKVAVKESAVSFTFIVTYGFAGYYIASLGQMDCLAPPKDKVLIAATGDHKAYLVAEEDIANYTIMAAVDPRAVNRNVHLRIPENHLSQNDLVALWEAKSGNSIEKAYESEEDMLKPLQRLIPNLRLYAQISLMVFIDSGSSHPSFFKAIKYFAFGKGGHPVASIEGSDNVEAVELYPEYQYISADHYLDRFLE